MGGRGEKEKLLFLTETPNLSLTYVCITVSENTKR